MTYLTDDELDAAIQVATDYLGKLRRHRRARKAGQASAQARSALVRDEKIRAEYHAMAKSYGALKSISQKFRLTTRQVQRILKARRPVLIEPARVASLAVPPILSSRTGEPAVPQKRRSGHNATSAKAAAEQDAFDFGS